MKPLNALSSAALLLSLSMSGIGCSSNPQAAQDRDHGYTGNMAFGESDVANPPKQAGYHQSPAAQPSQPDRGDTGNGAFGETPP